MGEKSSRRVWEVWGGECVWGVGGELAKGKRATRGWSTQMSSSFVYSLSLYPTERVFVRARLTEVVFDIVDSVELKKAKRYKLGDHEAQSYYARLHTSRVHIKDEIAVDAHIIAVTTMLRARSKEEGEKNK